MKFLLVLCCAVACAMASPGAVLAPAGVVAYSNVVPAAAAQAAYAEAPISYAAHATNVPVAYAAAPAVAPVAYAAAPAVARVAYAAAPAVAAPVVAKAAVAAPVAAPVAYAAPAPVAYAAPAAVAAAPVAAAVKTQYHAQNELGEAAYGHSEPLQAHSAVQDAYGNKVGAYSYVAPNGQVIAAKYVADALGYRVASNALPVGPGAPVVDTPEVAAAKAAHLAEVAAARSRVRRGVVAVGHTPASTAPLATAVAAPVAYAAPAPVAYAAPAAVAAPVSYAAPAAVASPISYAAHAAVAAPVAYAAPAVAAPVAYAAAPAVAAPVAYAAPAAVAAAPLAREATLTTIVNNPGHAVSYRVD